MYELAFKKIQTRRGFKEKRKPFLYGLAPRYLCCSTGGFRVVILRLLFIYNEKCMVKNFGLINEPIRVTDYVLGLEEKLGGTVWSQKIYEQTVNGDRVLTWKPWEPETEYQRKGIETNACVSFSGNNLFEYLANYEMEKDETLKSYFTALGLMKNGKANFSDRRTAKGSGTDPNRGNTVRAVDDYIRAFFFCPEDLWPFPDTMTVEEYYQIMSALVADFGKKVKLYFSVETKYLNIFGNSTPDELWEALKLSPVWVSVDGGNYQVAQNYTHRVCIRGGVYGKNLEIHDNYQNQITQLPWKYAFGAPKIANFIKNPLAEFIQVGSAILFLAKNGIHAGQYIGFGDGDILKAIHGEYSKVKPRETLSDLPANFVGSLFIK
ncbi:MAG: hypothetical protein WC243_03815 [Patescibacteria group bacterium]|jgi:hypothetical protein